MIDVLSRFFTSKFYFEVDLYAKMPTAQQTPDPYGSSGEAVWSRIDHCLYPYYEV